MGIKSNDGLQLLLDPFLGVFKLTIEYNAFHVRYLVIGKIKMFGDWKAWTIHTYALFVIVKP